MFKDGNSTEEGNLTSYLYVQNKHQVLDKPSMPTQKTLGL